MQFRSPTASRKERMAAWEIMTRWRSSTSSRSGQVCRLIPVVLPGILTAAIFAFTLSFEEYVYALTFISSTVNRTLPAGISVEMVRGDVYFWGPLMASAIIGSIPVVPLDWFISGMTTGAVK